MSNTTKAEITAKEEAAIKSFKNEFDALCENYGINAIVIGSRKETEKFSDEEGCSMCAAFATANISEPNLNELKALVESFDRAEEEIISKIKSDISGRLLAKMGVSEEELTKGLKNVVDILSKAFGKECDCENYKKESAQEEGAKFSEEKEIKFSKDGDKFCATFADFVNLQESPAGFGDTEEEAKADLLKNASL